MSNTSSLTEAEEKTRIISVSGDSQIRVEPDQIIISMAVMNKEKTLDIAKRGNDKTVKALINYFTETLHIEPKHVQTDYLSVNPVYYACSRVEESKGLCDPSKIQYYSLNKGIQVRLDDLTKYEAVIAKSLELGVNKINNIQFTTSELGKYKDKARELATIEAKENAQAVAKTVDMILGKPISIDINNIGWSYSGQRAGMGNHAMRSRAHGAEMHDDDGSSLAVGQINVTASVHINFEMK